MKKWKDAIPKVIELFFFWDLLSRSEGISTITMCNIAATLASVLLSSISNVPKEDWDSILDPCFQHQTPASQVPVFLPYFIPYQTDSTNHDSIQDKSSYNELLLGLANLQEQFFTEHNIDLKDWRQFDLDLQSVLAKNHQRDPSFSVSEGVEDGIQPKRTTRPPLFPLPDFNFSRPTLIPPEGIPPGTEVRFPVKFDDETQADIRLIAKWAITQICLHQRFCGKKDMVHVLINSFFLFTLF